MKLFLFVSSLFLFNSVHAAAPTYVEIPTVFNKLTIAEVQKVVVLDSRVISKIDDFGSYENRTLEIDLGIQALASDCEEMKELESLPGQSSLDSAMNPSDSYYRVNTTWKKGCATGSDGDVQYVKTTLTYFLSQREASKKGQPWDKPKFVAKENIRYISFNSGMMSGKFWWLLYKLDYSDIENVKFDLVKQYAYVQGESVN